MSACPDFYTESINNNTVTGDNITILTHSCYMLDPIERDTFVLLVLIYYLFIFRETKLYLLRASLVELWTRLRNCLEFTNAPVNKYSFVMHVTRVFNGDLGEFAGEFGIQSHQQSHHQKLELRWDVLYHIKNEITVYFNSSANQIFLAKPPRRHRPAGGKDLVYTVTHYPHAMHVQSVGGQNFPRSKSFPLWNYHAGSKNTDRDRLE